MNWNDSWGTIHGERLLLVPTEVADAVDLHRTVEETTFDYFSTVKPDDLSLNAFTLFLVELLGLPNQRTYTMRLANTGEAVGCSSYLDIRIPHRGLEVGFTWISPAWRGTYVNPEAKLLMLSFAFETLEAERVQLKCDTRNEWSTAAISKLGAKFEGRLRKHIVMPDGFVRDTLMYSVVRGEWPAVRERLENRLVGLT